MRQVISIHVGQAGIQVGNSCWELFCLQHNIQPDGTKIHEERTIPIYNQQEQNTFDNFFAEKSTGTYKPRAIFFDLEPTFVDKIRTGNYRHQYNANQLISGKQDADTFARGHYTIGASMIDTCLEGIRALTDQCSDFRGFMIYNSVGGGTGSGFASLLYERLSIEYPKKTKMGFTMFPSTMKSSTAIEPYNSVLATHKLIQHMDVGVFFDNQKLYDVCRKNIGISSPSLSNMNSIIARVVSLSTRSLRSLGYLHTDLSQFVTNFVPIPRMSFLVSCYSPIIPIEQSKDLSVSEITNDCFERDLMLAGCDPKIGKYMACALHYSGDIVPKDISASIASIKTKPTIKFVDWCPIGFKCGINYNKMITYPPHDNMATMRRQTCMLANTTAIDQSFARITYQFDRMYSKRSFVHHYTKDGMQEGEFCEARQDLAVLQKDYEEVGEENEGYYPQNFQ